MPVSPSFGLCQMSAFSVVVASTRSDSGVLVRVQPIAVPVRVAVAIGMTVPVQWPLPFSDRCHSVTVAVDARLVVAEHRELLVLTLVVGVFETLLCATGSGVNSDPEPGFPAEPSLFIFFGTGAPW